MEGVAFTDALAQRSNVALRTFTDCDSGDYEADEAGVRLTHTQHRVAAVCDAVAKHIRSVSPQQVLRGCVRERGRRTHVSVGTPRHSVLRVRDATGLCE